LYCPPEKSNIKNSKLLKLNQFYNLRIVTLEKEISSPVEEYGVCVGIKRAGDELKKGTEFSNHLI
jgi:hypothetical protein